MSGGVNLKAQSVEGQNGSPKVLGSSTGTAAYFSRPVTSDGVVGPGLWAWNIMKNLSAGVDRTWRFRAGGLTVSAR